MVQARKSHFIASRLLARTFYPNCEIYKDEFGKPHLYDIDDEISWSHGGDYAAIIASKNGPTGIDIEKISDRILKIQDKFCNETDLQCLLPGKIAESLLIIWTAKESMFKLYGRKEVDFKKHMTVLPFDLSDSGRYEAKFHKGNTQHHFLMEYEFFNHHIASWMVSELTESQAAQSY